MTRKHLDLLAWALLLLVPCAPVWPETAYCFTGEPGLTIGNFTLTAWDLSDDSAISTAGVTVVELGSEGEYHFKGLPDADATTDKLTFLAQPSTGNICIWQWPDAPPRATQAVTWAPTYAITSGRTLGVGDAGIDVKLLVSGLSANPAGSTVDFSLWCAGTAVVNQQPACVGGDPGCFVADSPVQNPTTLLWQATLAYDIQPADTATAARSCVGKFVLDRGTGSQITLPPTSTLTIDILSQPPS